MLNFVETEKEERSFEERIIGAMTEINVIGDDFSGDGWNYITTEIQEHQNVLIGEDHFIAEIPDFVASLCDIVTFNNFYIELDPYSTQLIKTSFSLTEEERDQFNKKYQDLFSFYALKQEYQLLEKLVQGGVNLLGADQIIMTADSFLCQDLLKITGNEKAVRIYRRIIEQSRLRFTEFLQSKDFGNLYFMTPEFENDLEELKNITLSSREHEIINAFDKSVKIYQQQNHNDRVRLLLNQVMKDYDTWKSSKNLFKYGANHLCRGESFLYVHDIGNLIATLSQANYSSSYHLMIVGMSGETGTPFRGFPPNVIDTEQGFYLNYLQQFFKVIREHRTEERWYVFNLRSIRLDLIRGNYQVDNINLERLIKGYDTLVIIPEVTPAEFPEM